MTIAFEPDVLDMLCPMHLMLDGQGVITHIGPTTQKLRPDMSLIGMRFLDAFTVMRPRGITTLDQLRNARHLKLHLEMAGVPPARLKGVLVSSGQNSAIVNLSFGISIVDGVRDYALTNADFAATDLAIEMLYLVEAKTAAMESSRKLNLRLQGAKLAAEEQAFTDTLTGLKNRRALDQVLERLLTINAAFAVMHIDLDYFKAVNDTLGHAAGDHVLQVVAKAMIEETRTTDTVARVGGDEFTVILPDVRDINVLDRIGRRIIGRIEVPIPFNNSLCEISASIGTVWIQGGNSATRETVMEDADLALYASKNDGRARQTFYTPELRKTANSLMPPTGRGIKRP
ncbi:diguanylate cyclase [Sulfitobacter sp. F26169L]|uniref:diguanylate cyclase domain-containing protein n=1 Tax=Sulfitobacter sp. F26169L TaxID=2996015 RepID=UPI002260FFD8|nr:diguanylate cyclase [Sulfitobacter sp. F26169L]MCX7566461.1 diguanylate cyclase [Sulfitobacter sp. F26169L]